MTDLRAYRCVITDPDGTELDVSDRLDFSELGTISLSPEDDLGIMTHGDMSLSLDNQDGAIEAYFSNAATDVVYEIRLERQVGGGDWKRMFGGVLDVATSLAYDDKNKTCEIDAYSYSKVLERTPADTIHRTISDKTGTITSGTKAMTISGDATDLIAGDSIRIDNLGGVYQELVVDRVISATSITVTTEADHSFSSCPVFCLTPFYRDKSPSYLTGLIAAETGMEEPPHINADLASFPIAVPLSTNGLARQRVPCSLVPTGTDIRATFVSGDDTNRRTLADPTDVWTAGSASNTPEGDWTPYLTSEPGAIKASSLNDTRDIGLMAWDHTNSRVYYLQEQTTGSPSFLRTLHLFRDSTDLGQCSTGPDSDFFDSKHLEYDPVNDYVWISFQRNDGLGGLTKRIRRCTNPGSAGAGAGTFVDFSTTQVGELRCCRPQNLMVFFDYADDTLKLYDLTSSTLSRTITPEGSAVLVWTIRSWGPWFAFLYSAFDGTYFSAYDTTSWLLVADYLVSPLQSANGNVHLTTVNFNGSYSVGVGFAGGEWFILSKRYDGVIAYANFESKSCAAGMREIAVVTASILNVDAFKQMSLIPRAYVGMGDAVADLAPPFEQSRKPIGDIYRASVTVRGKGPDDKDIEITAGFTGDSARRLEIESDFVTTGGVASSTAWATQAFLSSVGTQIDATIEDDGTPIAPFDRVTLNGSAYAVYKIETDLESHEHNVTLLGVS